ncbi:cytochrome c-type biogenesis protein [Parvularcula maris]|uniref:Cytochrome c-type biogenesis protein n=1 Tax=Parvularcula maris TaxID=2965077 RepID=A0A9X2LA07_9PROT|nr:cytochrome c-type biogenesis protein [Parvularcula maris]MCQ8185856.1 cytochrome c-type biogenesis protein CcmH [Parvularcula maris]
MIAAVLLFLAALTPEQAARAERIAKDIRCVVCQNQSVADSEAELAKVMRRIIEERIAAGDNDAEVRGYLVARYGETVLLRPTAEGANIVLWAAPAMVLVLGALWAFSLLRGGAKAAS